jgi:hypothetical protein
VGADKREENRLLVFQREVLRTIYGNTIEMYNFELNREFNSSNIIGFVKSNRLRYAVHMIRVAEDLPQRALCRAVPEGRRNQGRP